MWDVIKADFKKLYDTTPFKEGVGIDLARLSLEKAETLKVNVHLHII